MTESVRQLGILQPITVRFLDRENIYQIISGERRYHAAITAGFAEIPCWVQSPREQDILLHQVVENWQRADLHPFEIADALAALREANGYSQRQLAELTAKSEVEISKLLALLDLAPDAQKLAREDTSGVLTRRHLYAASHLAPDQQQGFLTEVREQRLTATEAEKTAAVRHTNGHGAKPRGAPVSVRRFVAAGATIIIKFRKQNVTDDDVVRVLDQVREKLTTPEPELRIVRPQIGR